jgi:uncharacterized iron-regulated protein
MKTVGGRCALMSIPMLMLASMLMLATACATHTGAERALAEAVSRRPLVLLGEVHDNAAQHAMRLRAFDALLASGARPALLLEQFDRERQADIDEARAGAGGAAGAVDRVIAAGSPPGARWDWAFYRPFIERALQNGLPIVAANVSRDDARRVVADGLFATGFNAAVPQDIEAAQAAAIQASHCGMVDAPLAQVARDQFMARSIEAHAERGVVLLTGNGHARRDIGVPRWLGAAARERSVAVGMLEEGDASAAAFDHVVFTQAQPRDDPCTAMRKPPANPR